MSIPFREDHHVMLPTDPPKYLSETPQDEGMPQEDYTWTEAADELALLTQLTLKQSTDLTRALEAALPLKAYEALPILQRFLTAISNNSFNEAGIYLARLLKLSSEDHRSTPLQP